MIIGIGFHARRIYIPYFTSARVSGGIPLCLAVGVDLVERKEDIQEYLKAANYCLEFVGVSPSATDTLSSEDREKLDQAVMKHQVIGVIISTEPLSHMAYADWALDAGLNILMDKPISTRRMVSSDVDQAKMLRADFDHLLRKYQDLQKTKRTVFTVNTQRRYDPGFIKALQLIGEAKSRFNIPVTSIQAMYADGTWVFPTEFSSQVSHPYNHGYGICSHSGYHIFDIVWQFYLAGSVAHKLPDEMAIYASFLNPDGFLMQLSPDDYEKLFNGQSRVEALLFGEQFGEVDASIVIRLLKDGVNICNSSINLLHNSFSRRSWVNANKDLYKGNGRVKHQQYVIQQGPFQCIHIHNYQASHLHDGDNTAETEVGGNNHFDIHLFRNAAMFGGGPAHIKYNASELHSNTTGGLTIETSKFTVIDEFIGFITGPSSVSHSRSNIDSHAIPVSIMSGIYMANCTNSVIKLPIEHSF